MATKAIPKQSAPSNNKAPAFELQSVTPAPRKRSERTPVFPADLIAQLAERMKAGDWVGDGQEYESRNKANNRVTRIKRALVYYGHYETAKQIKSRAWEDKSGKWRIAVTDGTETSA